MVPHEEGGWGGLLHRRASPPLGRGKNGGEIGNKNWEKHFSRAKRVLLGGWIRHRAPAPSFSLAFLLPPNPLFC